VTTLVFWQNMPTHHQSYWMRALAEQHGVSVRVILENGIPEWRKQIGWSMPDYGSAVVKIGISPELSDMVIKEAGSYAVHVFSGVGAYPGIHRAFIACIKAGRRVGVMAEMPGDYKSRLRKDSSRAHGIREFARAMSWRIKYLRFGRCIQFVLGVGEGAPVWFRKIGFAPDRMFEFAYFPPGPLSGETLIEGMWSSAGTRLLCIGRLVQIKGIDRLLRALSRLGSSDWELLLVGTGQDEANLRALTKKLQLANRIKFVGALPYPEAMSVLRGADVLILPSRIDGYGAVVNEALSRGVPVICSDQCGARQVVRMDPAFGSVFTTSESLCRALEQCISRGHRNEEATRTVQESAKCIAPESGANYFLQIISHIYENGLRPIAPWRMKVEQLPERST
jgi:glycosyltransferase involved in cell wall biosynthesis